jgi:hypothetical protein
MRTWSERSTSRFGVRLAVKEPTLLQIADSFCGGCKVGSWLALP